MWAQTPPPPIPVAQPPNPNASQVFIGASLSKATAGNNTSFLRCSDKYSHPGFQGLSLQAGFVLTEVSALFCRSCLLRVLQNNPTF